MVIHLIAPDPSRFSSGGNLYNRHLAEAMRNVGQTINLCENAKGPFGQGDVLVWDSLFLPLFLEMPHDLDCQSVLLVHSDSPLFLEHLQQLASRPLRFILTGKYMADVLLDNAVLPERCLLLEPGMSGTTPSRSAEKYLPIIFILVANLTPDKGVLDFIRLCQSRPITNPKFIRIHIYGDDRIDPDYAAACHQALEGEDVQEWISFEGLVSHDHLMHRMSRYHALLSVSPKESFGMAVREARTAGIPVLGIDGGNVRNLIRQKVDGLLFSSLGQLTDFLNDQLADPRSFNQTLNQFQPRTIASSDWSEQAQRLLSWLAATSA